MNALQTEITMLTKLGRELDQKMANVQTKEDVSDLIKQCTAIDDMLLERYGRLARMINEFNALPNVEVN